MAAKETGRTSLAQLQVADKTCIVRYEAAPGFAAVVDQIQEGVMSNTELTLPELQQALVRNAAVAAVLPAAAGRFHKMIVGLVRSRKKY